MDLGHASGTGTADFTVTANTLETPGPAAAEGVRATAGLYSDVCLDLRDNALAGIGQNAADLSFDRPPTASSRLRFAGLDADDLGSLQDHLRTANPLSSTLSVTAAWAGQTPDSGTGCAAAQDTP